MHERHRHLCLDMQRLFAADGPWPTPWMEKVLPAVARLAERAGERTIFTRFLTPRTPEDAGGMWRAYYQKWHHATANAIDPAMLDLVPDLQRFAPPAEIFDKYTYSAFSDGRLHERLRRDAVTSLVITGAETDVCVLSTVLGAIDLGYRVVIAQDAICSSSDESHDALIALYRRRFSVQIDLMDASDACELLAAG